MYEEYLSNPNVRAGLDVLAYCEGANYNTLFGGGTFDGWQYHPCRAIKAGGYTSTAAGRYQFLCNTWRNLQSQFGLADFSPSNQDLGAVILVAQAGGLQSLANGDLQSFVSAVRGVWPSLPGGSQQTRSWDEVTNYFQNDLLAQGTLPTSSPPQPIVSDGYEESLADFPLSGFQPSFDIGEAAVIVAGVVLIAFLIRR